MHKFPRNTLSSHTVHKKQEGFSLMEILIVIAIVGILVAVAMPSYQNYMRRARYTEVVQASKPYRLSVEECFQMQLALAQCKSGEHGIGALTHSGNAKGLVHNITVSPGGVITLTPYARYGIKADDLYILRPEIHAHQLHWVSSGKAVERGLAK